nr:hemolysin family protein [Martelella limonii]
MNQQQIVPLGDSGQDSEDGSELDEPNSPETGKTHHKTSASPLKGLLLYFKRNGNATSRLREDLEDALSADKSGENDFSPEERAMLNNILSFREVRVEDVMVPRADIDAVEQAMTIGELLLVFENCGHSRMPVFCETLDDPRGMVHIRDLLAYISKQARGRRRPRVANARDAAKNGATKSSEIKPTERQTKAQQSALDLAKVSLEKTILEAGLIRPVLFVPPSMLASDLLQRMQAGRTQMALVIDEYGGTDGLVSHEDIVEMVIGEIDDEHDSEEAMFTRVSDDVYLADARVELEDIAEAIGPDFEIDDHAEDVDTLGGLIFSSIGRIPARGEVIQLPGFEVHILDADPRRIRRVRILRKRGPARRRYQARAGGNDEGREAIRHEEEHDVSYHDDDGEARDSQ